MTAARNINLDVLETSSLERYYRTFKLSDSPIYSRDELVPLVVQHLTELNVDEDEILIRFALACRRNGQRLGLNGVKKPRSGSVKPRAR